MEEEEEEEGITVPSFPRPANSFQGSRTLPTGPNSKVIAPIPTTTRNCPSRNRGWPADPLITVHRIRDVSTIGSSAKRPEDSGEKEFPLESRPSGTSIDSQSTKIGRSHRHAPCRFKRD